MITVLGGSGFIGSNIVKLLNHNNTEYYAPDKHEVMRRANLGDIIYCVGVTANFRVEPFKTVDTHICYLKEILETYDFNSLTYLSSTRVYIHNKETAVTELDSLTVNPNDPDDLYNITKLTGESLCLASGRKTKIARISNVFAPDTIANTFLNSIIKEIIETKQLSLRMAPTSAKDYIAVNDVAEQLTNIANTGKEKIYNVASGINTSIEAIINEIKRNMPDFTTVQYTGADVVFPNINNNRIKTEFNYTPKTLIEFIPQFLKYYNHNV